MESLRPIRVPQRVSRTTCARVAGPCRAAVSVCSAPEPAGCRPALALQPPGTCDRADQESVSARDRGQCAAWKLTHPGRRGGSRRRAVVSDAAGIQRVPGVGTESLRADSRSAEGIQDHPARVAGPCRAAVSVCSAPEPAGCRPALALQPPGACSRADQESVSARDRGQCAAWKLTHPGGAGTIGAGPLVSDAAGIQRVPGVGTESLRPIRVPQRVSRTTCARVAGPCRAAVSACSAPEPAGCRPALALQPPGTCDRAIPEPESARERRQCAAWELTHAGGAGTTVAGP